MKGCNYHVVNSIYLKLNNLYCVLGDIEYGKVKLIKIHDERDCLNV